METETLEITPKLFCIICTITKIVCLTFDPVDVIRPSDGEELGTKTVFTDMDGSDRLSQQENSVLNDTGLLHDATDTTTNKHLPSGGYQYLEQSDVMLGYFPFRIGQCCRSEYVMYYWL